ncbi:MAG: MarR family transcriptional regulator [Erysipelotrichaceae bacterium]|nr:MarR family transcriptional regulator [Erysipelotrichaceae bacterium]
MAETINQEQYKNIIDQLHLAKNEMQKLMHLALKDVNLTREQVRVLSLIKYCSMSQKEIANELHITEATLSVRIKRLEQLGYLKRLSDPADKRRYTIKVTDKGNQELEASYLCHMAIVNHILKDVTIEEYEAFMSMTNRIIHNCQSLGEDYD